MYKVLTLLIAATAFLAYYSYVQTSKVSALAETNETLVRALERSTEAVKEKEKRTANELERLHKEIANLSDVNNACMSQHIDADTAKWLQQLSATYSNTLHISVTK